MDDKERQTMGQMLYWVRRAKATLKDREVADYETDMVRFEKVADVPAGVYVCRHGDIWGTSGEPDD